MRDIERGMTYIWFDRDGNPGLSWVGKKEKSS
jgi:hypothetical protein